MEPLLSEESSQDDLRVMSQQFALRIGPGGPSARVLPACAVQTSCLLVRDKSHSGIPIRYFMSPLTLPYSCEKKFFHSKKLV